MQDELVVADSAGHTMIDIEAARAADRARMRDAEPEMEQELAAESRGGGRQRRGVASSGAAA